MTAQRKADLLLVLVTLCWGSSYLFMKLGLASLQEFNLIGLRFGIAFVVAAVIFNRRLRNLDRKVLKASLFLGSLLFTCFVAIVFGVKHTTTANAGFLISLSVIFVPAFSAVLLKKAPQRKVWFGALAALTGIGLLTLQSRLSINAGDGWCIAGAALYGAYIIVTGILTQKVDSITLGVLQLGVAGGWGFAVSALTETPKLPATLENWLFVLGLSLLCSAFGFIGQTAAQRYTTAAHTGLIFSLEPIFAALFAFLFTGETLTLQGCIGATVVLAGVVSVELDSSMLKNLLSTSLYVARKY